MFTMDKNVAVFWQRSLYSSLMGNKWQFWVDRGGTFTDIVGRRPDGALISAKFLSENPSHYKDAALHGIRKILGDIPFSEVESLKLGTTVATNALLERKGEPTLFVTTKGFKDSLLIGDQRRPELFNLKVAPPAKLFLEVIEVDERLNAEGKVLKAPNLAKVKTDLKAAYDQGLRSVAIGFVHGYKNPVHENLVANLAREVGFSYVVTSEETVAVMKFVPRASTTVVDAYLSPILNRYVAGVEAEAKGVPLYFMQSSGGLAGAHYFKGKDALLSGPAGGIVGAVRTAAGTFPSGSIRAIARFCAPKRTPEGLFQFMHPSALYADAIGGVFIQCTRGAQKFVGCTDHRPLLGCTDIILVHGESSIGCTDNRVVVWFGVDSNNIYKLM